MTIQEQLDAKLKAYGEVSAKIAETENSTYRIVLKRQRNTITGECVVLRQALIEAEIKAGTFRNVPRLPFAV